MYNPTLPLANQKPLSLDVLVFKTNLDTQERIGEIKQVLNNTSGICKWNVDMHDCDNVLRIESIGLSSRAIEGLLRDAGFFCEELPD